MKLYKEPMQGISIHVTTEYHEKLARFSRDNNKSMSEVVRDAITLFFDVMEEEVKNEPVQGNQECLKDSGEQEQTRKADS